MEPRHSSTVREAPVLDAGPRSAHAPLGVSEVSEMDYAVEYSFRSGGSALSLFSRALHGLILRALANGPLRLADLRKKVGGPAQTTLRGNLDTLFSVGALEKRQGDGRANMVDNALTPTGVELLRVADAVDVWLARAPGGRLELQNETGKASIKALGNGWDSTMLRALAVRPFSLTEIDNLISAFSYPALERRLAAMRLAGFVVPVQGNGGGTPYAVADWLRQGMAPLIAAIRCERRHMADETAPLTRLDIETILLLALPLVTLTPSADGVSQLAVYGGDGSDWRSAGVRLSVRAGQLVSCTSKLEPSAESWIRGSAMDWLDALIEGCSDHLEVSGDRAITVDIVDGLHRALFIS
jgi:DNA-binding HxlR family transcriptional regulator